MGAFHCRCFSFGRNREKPRKKPTGDWYEVANQWKWEERADAYHKHRRSERDRQIAEKEADILDIPYAQKYERVKELDKKIRDLLKEADDEKRVWLPDVKSIQTGEDTYERVNLVHFNAPLFTVIDKYLAGIAAEMGERIKKKDIEVKGLPPNIYIGFDPNQDGTEL